MRLTLPAARNIALAAQGFGADRSTPVTMRQVQRTIDRVAQFQIDSVSVVARAQYLPVFSRLGPYDDGLLDRAVGRSPRRLFEYWGHAASMIDVQLEPALRFRMARASDEAWPNMRSIQRDSPELVARVLAEIAKCPGTARSIKGALAQEHPESHPAGDRWGWNWSMVKSATEWLFWSGQISVATRSPQFERIFDLPERVLPPSVASTATPKVPEAMRVLVRRAASALGVATLGCLTDYFRLNRQETAVAVTELTASGELIPVEVAGWSKEAWLWHDAKRPRHIPGAVLVSPFDSLVFERRRLSELFGFDYRIEIYVPADRRRYGYYVYPFLLDGRIVARVDLKADRQTGLLLVRSVWLEPGVDSSAVRDSLRAEIELMASWLGLAEVRVLPMEDWEVPGNGRPLGI